MNGCLACNVVHFKLQNLNQFLSSIIHTCQSLGNSYPKLSSLTGDVKTKPSSVLLKYETV